MRRLTARQARDLGRVGGKECARRRVGDSQWGRAMHCRRAALAMHRCYPSLAVTWARNAGRARRGLPPLPVPEVPLTGRRLAQREARRRARRREAYELARAGR